MTRVSEAGPSVLDGVTGGRLGTSGCTYPTGFALGTCWRKLYCPNESASDSIYFYLLTPLPTEGALLLPTFHTAIYWLLCPFTHPSQDLSPMSPSLELLEQHIYSQSRYMIFLWKSRPMFPQILVSSPGLAPVFRGSNVATVILNFCS